MTIKDCTLPEFVCHKVVRASEITNIELSASGCVLHVSGSEEKFKMPGEWWRKHRPEKGMIFVVYPDGYASVSPKEAFEQGYTLGSRHKIVVVLDQGVIADVITQRPMDVIKIDLDIEGCDEEELTRIPQLLYHQETEAHVRRLKEDIAPELVTAVHALVPAKVDVT